MFAFLSHLRSARNRQTEHRGDKHNIRPDLEVLEERTVPTIVFQPQFGAEGIGGSLTGGMQHPTVNVIFSGSYWTNPGTNGPQDQQTITAAIQSILSGPYLSGLTQYGSDGKANYGQTWNDPIIVPSNPSTAAVQTLLQLWLTTKSATPGIFDWQHAPIYVVISDPLSSNGSTAGWNRPGTYSLNLPVGSIPENMNMISVDTVNVNGIPSSTTSHVSTDLFSATFSHEIAEVMSDPDGQGVTISPGGTLPASLRGDNQICDNEPDAPHYSYRLNGVWVQPYWSKNDQAYIVPDGNSQQFTLTPIWNKPPGYTPWFSGNYNLHFSGDQLGANYNDNITLSALGSSVRLNANGQIVQFDPGVLNAVTIDTAGGSNRVQVVGLPSGVTANIGSIGQSNDEVIVGNGSLAGVQGTVNVSNSSGQTSLLVDDYLDTTGRVISVTNQSIYFSGLTTINYTGGTYANGPLTGVTYLQVVDGQGSNYVNIQSVAPLTPLYFDACYYDSIANDPPGAYVYFTHY
jgi:hypothetical protein